MYSIQTTNTYHNTCHNTCQYIICVLACIALQYMPISVYSNHWCKSAAITAGHNRLSGSLEKKLLPVMWYWLSSRVKKVPMLCKFCAVASHCDWQHILFFHVKRNFDGVSYEIVFFLNCLQEWLPDYWQPEGSNADSFSGLNSASWPMSYNSFIYSEILKKSCGVSLFFLGLLKMQEVKACAEWFPTLISNSGLDTTFCIGN